MSNDDELLNGMSKYKIITSFDKFDPILGDFRARMYHMTFYANDERVARLLMVIGKAPCGEVIKTSADYLPSFSSN